MKHLLQETKISVSENQCTLTCQYLLTVREIQGLHIADKYFFCSQSLKFQHTKLCYCQRVACFYLNMEYNNSIFPCVKGLYFHFHFFFLRIGFNMKVKWSRCIDCSSTGIRADGPWIYSSSQNKNCILIAHKKCAQIWTY